MNPMFGRRSSSTLVAASSVALVLFVAGCGVESADDARSDTDTSVVVDNTGTTADPGSSTTEDDGSSSATTEDETSTTEDDSTDTTSGSSVDDTIRSQLIDSYVSIGFTEDQATCLADEVLDSGLTSGSPEVSQADALEWVENCDISMSDLSKIGAG